MRFAASILVLLALMWSASANAALPPSELMEARLKQAREARKPIEAKVVLTLTGKTVREYRGTGKLATNGSLSLSGEDGSVVISSEETGRAGRLVHWLLLSSDPIAGLTNRGDFRPRESGVEVIDDAFGYRYGEGTAIVLNRSLDRVVEMRWREGAIVWNARFEYEGHEWPSVVSVTRSGSPHLRMEIEHNP